MDTMIPFALQDHRFQNAATSVAATATADTQKRKSLRLSHSMWMIVGFTILCVLRTAYLPYRSSNTPPHPHRLLGHSVGKHSKKHKQQLILAAQNHDFSAHSCQELIDKQAQEVLTSDAMCDFAQTCNDGEGLFAPTIYCHDNTTIWMLLLFPPLILLLSVLFRILGSTAEEFFAPGLETISLKLGFPERFAGVTLLALGNGAPDVAATVSAIINDSKRGYLMALGELSGAAMVATTLIVGVVIHIAQGVTCRSALLRDILVFIATMAVVFQSFEDGFITRREVHVMVGMYGAYCIIVLACDLYHKHKHWHCVSLEAAVDQDHSKKPVDREKGQQQPTESTPLTTTPASPPDFQRQNSAGSKVDRLIEAISNYDDCEGRLCDMTDEPLMVFHPHHGGIVDLKRSSKRDLLCDNNPQDDDSCQCGSPPESWGEAFTTGGTELKDHFLRLWKETLGSSHYTKIEKVLMACEMPFTILRMLCIPVPCDGYYCRPLVALSVAFSPLWMWVYLHVQFGFGSPAATIGIIGVVVIAALFILLGLLVLRYAPCGSEPLENLYAAIPLTLIGFVASASWLDLIADKLVDLLTFFGIMLHIPSTIMGLTVLAWGNASQDLIANMTVAKKGLSAMAITASFAGPVFNILIGLGIGLSILLDANEDEPIPVALDNTLRVGFFFCILNGFFVIIAGTCIGRGTIPMRYGYFAMATYAVYAISSVLA